ncbi:MAG: hypothetical protein AB7G68_06960 [Nitrospiraceae bacterium]
MEDLWASSASSLWDVLTEVRGSHTDRFSPERCHSLRKTGPSWPGALTRLRASEAALLQDMAWWGPMMEDRLHRWRDERAAGSNTSCVPR